MFVQMFLRFQNQLEGELVYNIFLRYQDFKIIFRGIQSENSIIHLFFQV